MTIDHQQVKALLEQKRSELQMEIALLRHTSPASKLSPFFKEVEERGEAAREATEQGEEAFLLQQHQQLLAQVEQALQRLEEGTYGYCCACGRPIPRKRLEVLPWATRDVSCEQREEKV